jgi:Helicase conserved C-terminal domain
MASHVPDVWPDFLRQTLGSYDETLLRQVAGKLCKPRSQWPASELIERCLEVYANPAVLDRRLKDLPSASRQVLALIGRSRQPRWPVGSLVEMLTALGHGDALAPVQTLLEAGLLLPVWSAKARLKSFANWLSQTTPPLTAASPAVTQRVLHEPLPRIGLDAAEATGPIHEADGLDWPLRLAVLWQQISTAPLRRTQQRDFFKRDLDRLRADNLLGSATADALTDLPDPGLFSTALALAVGVIQETADDLSAGEFSPAWNVGLPEVLAQLLAALPRVEGWNAAQGWEPSAGPGNPFPATNLLSLLALAQLPKDSWARPDALEAWMVTHHPFWNTPGTRDGRPASTRKAMDKNAGVASFLLGVAYPLRLLQACKEAKGGWAVRLSALGRWLLGVGEKPSAGAPFSQTLLVQPNLEILAYRQGLTPELLVTLTRFATWKALGAACTLQLEAHSVYRALEQGATLASIVQTLERHGMKATPAPVLDALKTWSNKRERITVFPAAVLLEFSSPADLNEALARGLPAVRLTDRLAAAASESQIDYKHFRLTGTRDYLLPAEPCVEVEADGVTLNVDLARSDLLLETEMQRFAEPATAPAAPGRRVYRLTPTSIGTARSQGLSLPALTTWFEQRTGLPLSPAARLLYSGADAPPAELRRQLVLQVADPETADGFLQWPATAALIRGRLGPTALVVAEADVPRLLERLRELGVRLVHEEG